MPERDEKGWQAASGFEALVDAVVDLMQTAVEWLRQEAEDLVQEKVVAPVQRLGLTLASASAAAALLALGIAFVAVAIFLLLADALGYPGALLIVGGALILGSVVFLVIKARSMQK